MLSTFQTLELDIPTAAGPGVSSTESDISNWFTSDRALAGG